MIACTFALAAQAFAFSTVAQGGSSQIQEPRTVVVRSTDEWQALWKEHGAGAAPTVDFTRSLVVGVFLGMRPSAGFGVQITTIRRSGTTAFVEFAERRPALGEITAQVLTSPFHLVAMPRAVEVVEFKEIGSGADRGDRSP